MNEHPIELNIDALNSRVHYYLIEAGQVDSVWMARLFSLHGYAGRNASDDNSHDFLKTAIVACVEYFAEGASDFGSWADDVTEMKASGTLETRSIEDLRNYEEGRALLDAWIRPEFERSWKARVDHDDPVEGPANVPVYHICHVCD